MSPSPPSPTPFQRGRFADLPELPRLPHPYFQTASREVVVDSAPFGRVRIHLKEHGQGPPLLLVHGLMTSSYSWRYVLDLLGARYRLYVPDLPGSGQSDCPDVPYTAAANATFLGELVGALGIEGCRVIGNSLGGYLCMRHALSSPNTFSRMVVVHSPGVPDPRFRALSIATSIPGVKTMLARVIRRDPQRWVHRNVHYWDESLKSLEEARAYGAPLSTEAGVRAFVRILTEVLAPGDVKAFAAQLAERRAQGLAFPVPLSLVYARQDPMVPPSVGEKLSALLPDARFQWLADTSHFAHVDSPGRMVDSVSEFLAGADA